MIGAISTDGVRAAPLIPAGLGSLVAPAAAAKIDELGSPIMPELIGREGAFASSFETGC
jgi:hypothetical protein